MKKMLLFVLMCLMFDVQSNPACKAKKSTRNAKPVKQQNEVIISTHKRGPYNKKNRQSIFMPLLQREHQQGSDERDALPLPIHSQAEIYKELSLLQDVGINITNFADTSPLQRVDEDEILQQKIACHFLAKHIWSTCDKQDNKIVMDALHQKIQQIVPRYPKIVTDVSYLQGPLCVDGIDIDLTNVKKELNCIDGIDPIDIDSKKSPLPLPPPSSLLDIARYKNHAIAQISLMSAFVYSPDR